MPHLNGGEAGECWFHGGMTLIRTLFSLNAFTYVTWNVLQMSWLLRRKTVSTCLHLKWQLCSASKNARQSIIESCTAEVPDPGGLVALHLLPLPRRPPLPTPGTEGSSKPFFPPFLQRRTSALLRLSLTFYSHFGKKIRLFGYMKTISKAF